MSDSAISVKNLTKRFRVPMDRSSTLKYRVTHPRSTSRYRDLLAVSDLSFEIPKGQFIGVIGHNGCGKSTLLKMLAGIYKPTSGSLTINGSVSPFLELGVGFNPELTARENVYLNGAVLGMLRRDLDKRIETILEFAGLSDRAEEKIKNYSSGMQVRLAFSVAIQANAAILLMDEVLAVGDANFQSKCFDVFARYRREGRTVVLVTHDLASVDRHCDRAILMDSGEMVMDGKPADVTRLYRQRVGEQIDEEAMAAPAPLNVLLTPGSRWGRGGVTIQSVTLTDGDGEIHHTFTSGKPMCINIEVLVEQAVDAPLVCGFGIHSDDGTVIAGTNTHICKTPVEIPAPGGTVTLQYRIEELNLLGGRFTISADVADASWNPFDHHEQIYDFQVLDETGRAGYFEMGGRWTSASRESSSVTAAAPEAATHAPGPG